MGSGGSSCSAGGAPLSDDALDGLTVFIEVRRRDLEDATVASAVQWKADWLAGDVAGGRCALMCIGATFRSIADI